MKTPPPRSITMSDDTLDTSRPDDVGTPPPETAEKTAQAKTGATAGHAATVHQFKTPGRRQAADLATHPIVQRRELLGSALRHQRRHGLGRHAPACLPDRRQAQRHRHRHTDGRRHAVERRHHARRLGRPHRQPPERSAAIRCGLTEAFWPRYREGREAGYISPVSLAMSFAVAAMFRSLKETPTCNFVDLLETRCSAPKPLATPVWIDCSQAPQTISEHGPATLPAAPHSGYGLAL